MGFMGLGALGLLGGLGGALIGGSAQKSSANAQIAAEERARQQTMEAILRGQGNIAGLLKGYNPETRKYLQGILGGQSETLFGRPATAGSLTQDEQRQLESLTQQRDTYQNRRGARAMVRNRNQPDPELERINTQIAALQAKSAGDPGHSGLIDPAAYDNINDPGLLSQYSDLARSAQEGDANILSQFDAETGRLGTDWAGLERQATTLGKGEKDRIDREAGDTLTQANRLAGASLRARGLGNSSLVGNQVSQNARRVGFAATDQKNAVDDSITNKLLSLGQNRIGTQAARGTQRVSLQLAGQDRQTNLGLLPLQLQERLLAGQPFNAATGVNYSQFNSGASPSAGMSNSLGNFLSSAGGLALGYGAQSAMYGGGGGGVNSGLNTLGGGSNPFSNTPYWMTGGQ